MKPRLRALFSGTGNSGNRVTLRLLPLDYASCLGILAYAISASVTPIILVVIARELSLSLVGGGIIEVARSGLILVLLLGSGIIGARWGKPLSLGVSCLVIAAGMLLYSVAPFYGAILLAAALLGAGGGVVEGLLSPLIQDLHRGESARYLNIINGFWSVGFLLTMLFGGELLSRDISWRLVVGILGLFSALAGVLFLILQNQTPPETRFNPVQVLAHKWTILRIPRFWLFMGMMLTAGAAEGAIMFWSATFIQLEFDALPRAAGVGAAFFAGGMVAGRFGVGLWVHQRGLRQLMIVSVAAGILISAGLPFSPTLPAMFASLFIVGIAIACFWPTVQSYAADRLPVETTSLFILLSCAGISGFALASWLLGLLGELVGLRAAFLVIPVFLLILGILLLIERYAQRTQREG